MIEDVFVIRFGNSRIDGDGLRPGLQDADVHDIPFCPVVGGNQGDFVVFLDSHPQ